MSLYEYEMSRKVSAMADWGEDFYGLVMALMRHADTQNLEKLKAAWPDVWVEMQDRYNAPGGLLLGEKVAAHQGSRGSRGRRGRAPRRRSLRQRQPREGNLMSRTIRHLQHGNVTVSINGPTELVDDLRVSLRLHGAGGRGSVGHQIEELDRKVDLLGGEYEPLEVSQGFAWRRADDPEAFELAVFG